MGRIPFLLSQKELKFGQILLGQVLRSFSLLSGGKAEQHVSVIQRAAM